MRVFYLFLCILSQLGTGNFLPIATTWYEKKKKNNVWKCACIVATTNTARRDNTQQCLVLKHGPICCESGGECPALYSICNNLSQMFRSAYDGDGTKPPEPDCSRHTVYVSNFPVSNSKLLFVLFSSTRLQGTGI